MVRTVELRASILLYPLAVLCLLSSRSAGQSGQRQTCYWSDGTPTSAKTPHTPCNTTTTGFTHCCLEGGVCLGNGLCFMPNDWSLNTGACTDKTYQAEECFSNCLSLGPRLSDLWTLFRCDGNQWCCSEHGTTSTCCPGTASQTGRNTFPLPPGKAGLIQNASAFVPGYAMAQIGAVAGPGPLADSAAPGATGSALAAAPACTSESSGGNGGGGGNGSSSALTIGLALGVGLGVLLLAAVAALGVLLRRERRERRARQHETLGAGGSSRPELPDQRKAPLAMPNAGPGHAREKPGAAAWRPHELHDADRRAELASRVGSQSITELGNARSPI